MVPGETGTALDRELQLALLGRHRPELRYHPNERCIATSVEAVLDPSAGVEWAGLRAPDNEWIATTTASDGALRLTLELLRGEGALYRADQPQRLVNTDDHLDFDFVRGARLIGRDDVAYGRVFDWSGGHWLQYWLFYADNPHVPVVGVHEGDWELVQVSVPRVVSPADVEGTRMLQRTYSQHGHPESRPADADSAPVPIVYVAKGSHASYYEQGDGPFTDHTSDEGRRVRPEVRLLSDYVWLDWPGRWGATSWRLLRYGNQSPKGPAIKRSVWNSPQEFNQAGLGETPAVEPQREEAAWSAIATDVELSADPLDGLLPRSLNARAERVPVRLLATALSEDAAVADLRRQAEEVAATLGGGECEIAGFDRASPIEERVLMIRFDVAPGDELRGPHASFEAARLMEAGVEGWEIDADVSSVGFSPAFLETPERSPGEDNLAWALEQLRCRQAWDLPPRRGGRSKGEGVLIGHPDTGYLRHAELESGAIAATLGYDVVDDDPDAVDASFFLPPFAFRGHGTGTASVIVSRSAGELAGSAPLASVAPFRCTSTVILLRASGLIAAIKRARAAKCRVISISLGGVFLNAGLRCQIREAVSEGIIVIAAAGQPFPFVVEPASYPECIAVGGTNIGRGFWDASARGAAVDVSAPAVNVPRASARTNDVKGGTGTSFSTALTAGVAALWLAHHGDELQAELGAPELIPAAFAEIIRRTTSPGEGDWDAGRFGAGIVDAEAALKHSLTAVVAEIDPAQDPIPAREDRVLETLARLTERPREATGEWLEEAVDGGLADTQSGVEIVKQIAEDFELRERVSAAIGDASAVVPEPIRDRASPSLRAALSSPP